MIQIGTPATTIDSPIDHLMACHRRIEQRLDTLVNAGGQIKSNRTAALDAIRKSLQFMDSSGALHTADEESSLFPRLRPKLSHADSVFLDSLEGQHKEADAIYADLKASAAALDAASEMTEKLTVEYQDCAARLRALYREHIRVEDERLIAIARQSLGEADTRDIAREMRSRRA